MLNYTRIEEANKKHVIPVLFAYILCGASPSSAAESTNAAKSKDAGKGTVMTAGIILDRMSKVEQRAYIAGIVAGFAYYTAKKSGPKDKRVACIYEWLYGDSKKAVSEIAQTFTRFRKHVPAAIVSALINRKCGKA